MSGVFRNIDPHPFTARGVYFEVNTVHFLYCAAKRVLIIYFCTGGATGQVGPIRVQPPFLKPVIEILVAVEGTKNHPPYFQKAMDFSGF